MLGITVLAQLTRLNSLLPRLEDSLLLEHPQRAFVLPAPIILTLPSQAVCSALLATIAPRPE